MAFLIYRKTATGPTVRYEKVKPIKLSGRDGLVAQHVRTLSIDQTRSWKLDTASLLSVAGIAPLSDPFVVLFDVSSRNATNACFYELLRIRGSCAERSTQLVFDFDVLMDQETGNNAAEVARAFEIPPRDRPKLFGETLGLSGGPGGGDWQWVETSLQLGATVVQAQAAPAIAGKQ